MSEVKLFNKLLMMSTIKPIFYGDGRRKIAKDVEVDLIDCRDRKRKSFANEILLL